MILVKVDIRNIKLNVLINQLFNQGIVYIILNTLSFQLVF